MKSTKFSDWDYVDVKLSSEDIFNLSSAPVRFYGPTHRGLQFNLGPSEQSGWAVLAQSDFINQVESISVDPAKQAHLLEEQFRAAFGYTQRVSELCKRLENIEAALVTVVKKLDRIATEPHFPLWVPIESLTGPYKVLRSMTCVVVPVDDGFEAALYDLNLYSAGDTQEEAVASLKSLLLDLFDHLTAESDDHLGPEPLKQKNYLLEHIAANT